ncbi:DUF4349 domain-containing protein [Nocardioides pinisoli]|uniref:DUF4349 domain-containing protein n=1 Tax=Nocardioides pinisoli TaxID=2950279 RepID=A0ABT1KZ82_9ACTN|nr:DUF4349 domain-containing protein [Nocardioides pinisoli]MCP3423070.1 DUF4349 domain-containing protein [Nocardioides pinisoli]
MTLSTTLTVARARTAGVLTALTMTALLAACSAGDSGDGGGDATSGDVSSEASNDASGSSSGNSSGSSSDRSAPGADAGATAEDSTAGDTAGDGPTTPELRRSVISSGTVSLAGEDVRETRRDVQRVVDAQGGEITEETTETDSDGDTSYVRMVVRVPSAKFGETMSALEQVGVLRSSDRGSEDVTTQVIDNGARVRAQEASLRRVELLLADARDLKDVIWIESQLTGRQAELDSLKSQQSWLADQTSLSTITVDISTHQVVEDAPEEKERPSGFLAGLDGGSKALGAVVTVLSTVLGALLPFAAVALVIGLPVWLVVRRRRGATTRTPAA